MSRVFSEYSSPNYKEYCAFPNYINTLTDLVEERERIIDRLDCVNERIKSAEIVYRMVEMANREEC